jgi:hypothetical protein
MRRAAVLAALLMLGACGQADKAGGDDRFAGLDAQMLSWRQEVLKTDRLCLSQAAGQKCEGFEVVCKAERVITPAEAAAGVTAKVVGALNWNGFDSKSKQSQRGSATALFTRTNGAWTRAEHPPVNLSSCADL